MIVLPEQRQANRCLILLSEGISLGRDEEFVAAYVAEEKPVFVLSKPAPPLFCIAEILVLARISFQQSSCFFRSLRIVEQIDQSAKRFHGAIRLKTELFQVGIHLKGPAAMTVTIHEFKVLSVIIGQALRVALVLLHQVRGKRGGKETLVFYPVYQKGKSDRVEPVAGICMNQRTYSVEPMNIADAIEKELASGLRHLGRRIEIAPLQDIGVPADADRAVFLPPVETQCDGFGIGGVFKAIGAADDVAPFGVLDFPDLHLVW